MENLDKVEGGGDLPFTENQQVDGKNIGTIDIVIAKLMKNLSSKDLLHFRLVNRQWRDQATSILLKRQDLNIDLVFSKRRNVYQMCNEYRHRPHHQQQQDGPTTTDKKNKFIPTLEDLVECIKGSKSFLCVNFSFIGGDFVRDGYQLEQFFHLFGKNIKKLGLNLTDVLWPSMEPSPPLMFAIEMEDESTTEAHIKKLMKLVPNLEYLHIQSLPKEFWEFQQRDEDEEKGEKFVFSSLQILNLEGFKKTFDNENYNNNNNSNNIRNKKKNKRGKNKNKKKKKRTYNYHYDAAAVAMIRDGNNNYCGFLDLILKSATNLIATENFPVEFVREFVSNPKSLDTIKAFNCTPTSTNLEYLREYSLTCPKLEEFGFHLQKTCDLPTNLWRKIVSSLNQILKSSSDTMKRISYFHPLGFFQHGGPFSEQVEIPIMKALESIQFGEKSLNAGPRVLHGHCEMFPSFKEFQLTRQFFPSLKKISFCFSKVKTESFLIKYLKNFLVTPCLMEELEIEFSQQLSHSVVEKIAVMFPFVQGLSIKNVTDFHSLGKSIFKCFHQNLTSLKLSGNIMESCFNNQLNTLDSSVTGISTKVCDRLRNKLEEDEESSRFVNNNNNNTFLNLKSYSTNNDGGDDDDEAIDFLQTSREMLNMREFSSIRDMKKLENFTLELSEVSTMNWFLPNVAIFSAVADAYGFKLMPMLKVKIILKDLPEENRAEILKKFQDFSSNVSIITED